MASFLLYVGAIGHFNSSQAILKKGEVESFDQIDLHLSFSSSFDQTDQRIFKPAMAQNAVRMAFEMTDDPNPQCLWLLPKSQIWKEKLQQTHKRVCPHSLLGIHPPACLLFLKTDARQSHGQRMSHPANTSRQTSTACAQSLWEGQAQKRWPHGGVTGWSLAQDKVWCLEGWWDNAREASDGNPREGYDGGMSGYCVMGKLWSLKNIVCFKLLPWMACICRFFDLWVSLQYVPIDLSMD